MDTRPTPDEIIKARGFHWLDKKLDRKIDRELARWDRDQEEKARALLPKPPKPEYKKIQKRPYIWQVRKTGQRPPRESHYDPLIEGQ